MLLIVMKILLKYKASLLFSDYIILPASLHKVTHLEKKQLNKMSTTQLHLPYKSICEQVTTKKQEY